MKKTIILAIIMSLSVAAFSQKYFTKSGKIYFSSETPIEKIEATNNSATSVIDAASGNVEFAVLIKGFLFEKALMQEHFNENYMESDKFPKATFKGKIVKYDQKSGTYDVEGDLTLHGVTNKVKTKVTVASSDSKVSIAGAFSVKLNDYKIEIPSLAKKALAETAKISFKIDVLNK
jgi:uncharacterized protein YdeI (BOF family)